MQERGTDPEHDSQNSGDEFDPYADACDSVYATPASYPTVPEGGFDPYADADHSPYAKFAPVDSVMPEPTEYEVPGLAPARIVFNAKAQPDRNLMWLAEPSAFDRRPTTIAADNYRAQLLYRDASSRRTVDANAPHEARPHEVVDDLIASLSATPPRSAASWRANRRALLHAFRGSRHEDKSVEYAFQVLLETPANYIAVAVNEQPVKSNTDTALGQKSRRRPGIPRDDLLSLLNVLEGLDTSQSRIASCVRYWLMAAMATGAKRAEWPGVAWDDRENGLLSVPTVPRRASQSKAPTLVNEATHEGKGSAEHEDKVSLGLGAPSAGGLRRIVCLNCEEARWVDLHLKAMDTQIAASPSEGDTFEASYKNYYDRCRNVLLYACQTAFGKQKRYTLDMARAMSRTNSATMDRETYGIAAPKLSGVEAQPVSEEDTPESFWWRNCGQGESLGMV